MFCLKHGRMADWKFQPKSGLLGSQPAWLKVPWVSLYWILWTPNNGRKSYRTSDAKNIFTKGNIRVIGCSKLFCFRVIQLKMVDRMGNQSSYRIKEVDQNHRLNALVFGNWLKHLFQLWILKIKPTKTYPKIAPPKMAVGHGWVPCLS